MTLQLFSALAVAILSGVFPVESGAAKLEDVRRYAEERENQWIHRTLSGGGGSRSFAIFLSSNYSEVIFKAWCEAPSILIIQYFGDASLQPGPMAIIVGPNTDSQSGWQMETTAVTGGLRPILEGRIVLTSEIRTALERLQDEIGIDAPNEMAEPWYVGSAPALRQVIAACK